MKPPEILYRAMIFAGAIVYFVVLIYIIVTE